MPYDTLAGVVIVLACLGLVAIGKDTVTVNGVLTMAVGFMFGKYTHKKGK